MDFFAVALLILGCAFIVLAVLFFYFLRGLSRGTIDVKYSFRFTQGDLEQLKQRADFGAHWVVGTSFVLVGSVLIWHALNA